MADFLRELHIVHLHFVCVLYALARLLSALSIFLEGALDASSWWPANSHSSVLFETSCGSRESVSRDALSVSKMRMSTRLVKGIYFLLSVSM